MVQKFKCEFKISLAPFFTISFYSYLVQTFLCHHMYLFNHIISTLVLSCPEVLRLLPGGRKKMTISDRLFLILRSLVWIRFITEKKWILKYLVWNCILKIIVVQIFFSPLSWHRLVCKLFLEPKVKIFLEQREVAFLSPSKICENLNFSTEIQIFANFAGW